MGKRERGISKLKRKSHEISEEHISLIHFRFSIQHLNRQVEILGKY